MSNPTDLRRAKAIVDATGTRCPSYSFCVEADRFGNDCTCYGDAVFAIAAIRASDEAAGMVLVPKEASKQQILAGLQAAFDYYGRFRLKALWPWSRGNHPSDILRVCYCAMLAAHGGEDG